MWERPEGKQLKVGHYWAGYGFKKRNSTLLNHRRGLQRSLWIRWIWLRIVEEYQPFILKCASGGGNIPILSGLDKLLGHWWGQILSGHIPVRPRAAMELLFSCYRKMMEVLQNLVPCLKERGKQLTNGWRRQWLCWPGLDSHR